MVCHSSEPPDVYLPRTTRTHVGPIRLLLMPAIVPRRGGDGRGTDRCSQIVMDSQAAFRMATFKDAPGSQPNVRCAQQYMLALYALLLFPFPDVRHVMRVFDLGEFFFSRNDIWPSIDVTDPLAHSQSCHISEACLKM